jgi:DNA-binding transcriptional LysR family regulator
MNTRRLQMLLELSRLGSMAAVAERLGTTTSTVSQQLAALARETGAALVEPHGRRVRLTPAGRRLAAHAITILGAVDAALADLQPNAAPSGTVRVSGFASAIRRALLPIVAELAAMHPDVRILVHEHEPYESLDLLAADEIDLALTYDYNLAPAATDPTVSTTPLWTTRWGLAVSTAAARHVRGSAVEIFARFRHHQWIGNSRNAADEEVIRLIGSMAGFVPKMAHQVDSLDLVEELIVADMGIGLLPADRATRRGVTQLRLRDPDVVLRAHACFRHGRDAWAPLALVLERLLSDVRPPAARRRPAPPAPGASEARP